MSAEFKKYCDGKTISGYHCGIMRNKCKGKEDFCDKCYVEYLENRLKDEIEKVHQLSEMVLKK